VAEAYYTDEFGDWYDTLDETDQVSVDDKVDLLEVAGVSLGRPHTGTIKRSAYAMRELVVQSKGRPLRIFYCFDPRRDAVLILGGDKTGDERFYERMVPLADKVWQEYLREQGSEKRGK
jgi:hypothetical protein